jgi:hypothetical protein
MLQGTIGNATEADTKAIQKDLDDLLADEIKCPRVGASGAYKGEIVTFIRGKNKEATRDVRSHKLPTPTPKNSFGFVTSTCYPKSVTFQTFLR